MSFNELRRLIDEGRLGPEDVRKIHAVIERTAMSDTEREELLALLSEKSSYQGSSCCEDC
jgi:hypothetical protein